jgi:hypothetical protein
MFPYDRDETFAKAMALLKEANDTASASHRANNIKEVRKLLKAWEVV